MSNTDLVIQDVVVPVRSMPIDGHARVVVEVTAIRIEQFEQPVVISGIELIVRIIEIDLVADFSMEIVQETI